MHGGKLGQLGHGGNAAAGRDFDAGNRQKLTVQRHIGALHRAVPGNIGGNNGLDARIGAAAAECHARLGGDLLPAVDSDSAVLHVNADGDPCAVFLCHFCREIEVFYGHRAQNAAVRAEVKIPLDARLVADAAADLDFEAAQLGNGGNRLQIGRGVVLGAVQIDDMQILRTCVDKLLRLGDGVCVVDGHPVVIALIKPHGLAAAQVNGGV